MIVFVVRRGFQFTIGEFLTSERSDPNLASKIRVVSYERLFSLPALPAATFVFCDHERLSVSELERLAWVWARLRGSEAAPRLLNDPFRVRRRYDLLQTLAQSGVNAYRAYRITEPGRPKDFPVFLRGENDHRGPSSKLLANPVELEAAIERRLSMLWRGTNAEPTLIVEYCAQPDAEGHFTKFAAFRVGDQIIARHRFVSEHWAVKRLSVVNARTLREEYEYVDHNPHKEALRGIFEAAHIDYGRIDYALVGDKIQVYEINTNPMTVGWVSPPEREHTDALFAKRFCAALRAIDSPQETECIHLSAGNSATGPVSARVCRQVQNSLEEDHHWSLRRTLQYTLSALRPVVPYPSRILLIGDRQLRWLWQATGVGLPFKLKILARVASRMSVEILRTCWIRRCRGLRPPSGGAGFQSRR